MEEIQYIYGRASLEASALIVGTQGTPNPLADRRSNLLPFNKLKIGDSLTIVKKDLPVYKWKLAKSTVIRWNRMYVDCMRIVEDQFKVEIVRII